MKKLISFVTPCFNEEDNVRPLYEKIKEIMLSYENYIYEHIFIDNASIDKTADILKDIARNDKNVKIIINSRNFGHVRSPYYGIIQSSGDATIFIAADFQDPPELIPGLIKKWEEGYKIVFAIKKNSEENLLMWGIRSFYYRLIDKLSEVRLERDFTGFGLYDRKIIGILRDKFKYSYPYLRGIVCEIGFERARIYYHQPARKRGITKNNFYTLYDLAMTGITSHSKIPLRTATFFGFLFSILSLFTAMGYLIYKILFWKSFNLGIAPLVVGLFFFSSINLFFLGILGEYIASIHNQVMQRPLVIEKERINFEKIKNRQ